MANKLNIMLFSDHGMTKIQWMEKVIELDKHINMSDIVKTMDRGPVISLWPKDGKYQMVRLKPMFSDQLSHHLSLRTKIDRILGEVGKFLIFEVVDSFNTHLYLERI